MAYMNYESETTWRINEDAAERREAAREQRERDNDEFFEPRVAVAKCDGSGVIEEYYFDVDQTYTLRCPGCFACALRESQEAAESQAPAPIPAWVEEESELEYRRRIA